MSRHRIKRLVLTKETIRTLTETQLARVNAAGVNDGVNAGVNAGANAGVGANAGLQFEPPEIWPTCRWIYTCC